MCNDILPNTWAHPISVAFPMIACFPVYAERCPKCGYSLVEGRPPLTEAEILEDKRKQRRKMAGTFGIGGLVMFIYFLIILVLVKKGEI